MKTKLFVMDGNWALHRAFSAAGMKTAIPHKKIPLLVLEWFCQYSLRLRCTGGALCFDGPNNFRYQLYPAYKANRGTSERGQSDDTPSVVTQGPLEGMLIHDAVYSCLEPTMDLFHRQGLLCVQEPELEGDDLMISFAHYFGQRPNYHVYMGTKDKDAFQGVTENVTVYHPEMMKQPEVLYTPEMVKKKTGLTPRQFLNYQILVGDMMDNVPPVMTPAAARAVVRAHKKLSSYFNDGGEGEQFYNKNASELHRNKNMVTLLKDRWKHENVSFKGARGTAPSKSFTALVAENSKASLF